MHHIPHHFYIRRLSTKIKIRFHDTEYYLLSCLRKHLKWEAKSVQTKKLEAKLNAFAKILTIYNSRHMMKIKLYILWHLSNQRLILHISPHKSCSLCAWKEISLQRISFRRICNGHLTRLQDENSAFVENSNSAEQCLQTGSWISWTWGSPYKFFSNKSKDYSRWMWRKWIQESIAKRKPTKNETQSESSCQLQKCLLEYFTSFVRWHCAAMMQREATCKSRFQAGITDR